ncbi:hypothetical protein [Streptomyces parvus]|uniref:hypothetical protein n=1 Tax=Streptomyces parvus TaxID=66428 RepID=UPI00381049F5
MSWEAAFDRRCRVNALLVRWVWWPLLVAFAAVARVWTVLNSTSHRGARRLAGSDAARQAGRAAEARLRAIVGTYVENTPLELRLLVIEDHYSRGWADLGLLTLSRSAYRASCEMRVTAYFSSPLPLAETLAHILDAGERGLSGIPFTYDLAPGDSPGELAHAGHVLTWNQSTVPLPEHAEGAHDCRFRLLLDPPIASNVASIRRRHGAVFALALPPTTYFRVLRRRDGRFTRT